MPALKKQLIQSLTLIFFSTLLLASHPAMAETDLADQKKLLNARVMSRQQNMDHAAHLTPVDKNLEFHGVFLRLSPLR